MKKIKLLFFIVFIINTYYAVGQNYLYGEQSRGSENNGELTCQPVVITTTVEIYKVEGDNNGFWIENKNGIVKSFFLKDEKYAPPVVSIKLEPGKYWIYPNLKIGKKKATIKIYFK